MNEERGKMEMWRARPKPQHTADEKFKECVDIYNIMESKRAEGEMKNAKPRVFRL